MRSFVAFSIFLPQLILSGMIWDKPVEIKDARYGKTQFLSFPTHKSDSTYIFWINYEGNNLAIHFQIRLADGSLTSDRILNSDHLSDPSKHAGMSAQVSDDGDHLMLAYHGYRFSPNGYCSGSLNDGCLEIFFIESLNGGKDWSSPIKMFRDDMLDVKNRQYPSMIFEKDTKQIYIGYVCNGEFAIAMKKPGSKSFEKERLVLGKDYIFALALGYTVDKARSRRYLHMFWKKDRGNSLYYTNSTDEGKTWSKNLEICKDVILQNPPAFANDPQASEGGLFIQYFSKKNIEIIYSENHGGNWATMKSGLDFHGSHAIGICGTKGKEKLFSMNARIRLGTGYVRYKNLTDKNFTSVSYPFGTPQSITLADLHCAYDGKNKYAVSALVHDDVKKAILLVHGVMETT